MFSVFYCLAENPNVANSGGDPLTHFCKYGFNGGGNPSPVFVVEAYLINSTEVKYNGINALAHLIHQNKNILKNMYLLGMNGGFSSTYYIKNYLDIVDSGLGLLKHYFKYGCKEGESQLQLLMWKNTLKNPLNCLHGSQIN